MSRYISQYVSACDLCLQTKLWRHSLVGKLQPLSVLMHTMVTAEGAARLFLHHVWKSHGLPKHIISNHGVTLYKHLGKINDILYLNNKNNQLER